MSISDVLGALKGYRTMIVAAIVGLASVLVSLHVIPADKIAGLTEASVGDVFDAWLSAATGAVAALMAIMRLFTTSATGVNPSK